MVLPAISVKRWLKWRSAIFGIRNGASSTKEVKSNLCASAARQPKIQNDCWKFS